MSVSTDHPSALVVGAGAFGCAAADALAARGWDVTIIEQYAPANARGSSGDRTRQLRHGHGAGSEEEDLWYIRSAQRGIVLWRELSIETGTDLIEPTGLVWLATAQDGLERRVAERLGLAGIPCERLTPTEVAQLFPDIATDDLAFGLREPDAGVIRARDAVLAVLGRARAQGARLVRGRALPHGRGEASLQTGERLAADCVIWACGPWLGQLFPRDAEVRPAWQEVVHWHAPRGWERTPTWFDDSASTYGFPDVDGLGVKAASDVPGPSFDLEHDDRTPRLEAMAALGTYLARRFPALAGTHPLWARVMGYEMTPDGHFILGRAADAEGHWLLGGGSGHGFKHALALGELLADVIEGRRAAPEMLSPGSRVPSETGARR